MANPIIFRKNSDIGAADAESDNVFLGECFVDTGDLETLLDTSRPNCIVLGRTGSGKTALLKQVLAVSEHAVELAPEALALNFVSNSNVLKFFEKAGVNLDVFYTLLSRHIITVELLKLKYAISNNERQAEFFDKLRSVFSKEKAKERALAYLREWGDKFWEETEYRTKEFTRKLERDLTGNAKIDTGYVDLGIEGARKLTEEQKIEVRKCGVDVVNEVQVKALHDIIELLAQNVFDEPYRRYYIVIDRLDEDWVGDKIRFKLIKALIEATKTFRKIPNFKIIVAIRSDLHYRMLRETASQGFQEEKYRSLYLNVTWRREQLVTLLDRRVNYLFRRQYTKQGVCLADILPSNQIEQRSAIDHILDRTFFRPREAIIFLNECIKRAEGTSRITVQLLRQSEMTYSQQRQISLADEWRSDYPNLIKAMSLLKRKDTPFRERDFTKEDCEKIAISILEDAKDNERDAIFKVCQKFYLQETVGAKDLIEELIRIFYTVGLVGIKPEPHLSRQWSYLDDPVLNDGVLSSDALIDIHRTFWLSLGITRRRSSSGSEQKPGN